MKIAHSFFLLGLVLGVGKAEWNSIGGDFRGWGHGSLSHLAESPRQFGNSNQKPESYIAQL